ncbi:GTPase activating protein 1-like [Gouania willdenowi]|uniref:GTPase activating protein 1-like n=1 Tax=Gouania willdenowi TaxID=441366 RepID=UPI0010545610|nr:GTPase activating protein 1-like [Gouania willdenowi]
MKFGIIAVLLAAVFFQNSVASSCYGKNVEVIVINGIGMTGDGLLRPDPYVEVTIGDLSKKTRVIHSTRNPFWYQELLFNNVDSNEMTIDVWDRDSGFRGSDDHIGSCTEDLSSHYDEYVLVECHVAKNGIVNLKYKCYGNSQEEEY